MADPKTVNGYGTPEYIAFLLLQEVIDADRMLDGSRRDKKWLLDNYADCLKVTRGYDWEGKRSS